MSSIGTLSNSSFQLKKEPCISVRVTYTNFRFVPANDAAKNRLKQYKKTSLYAGKSLLSKFAKTVEKKQHLKLNIAVLHPETGDPIRLTDEEWQKLVQPSSTGVESRWKKQFERFSKTTDIRKQFYFLKNKTKLDESDHIDAELRFLAYTNAHEVDYFIVLAEFSEKDDKVEFRAAFPLTIKNSVKGAKCDEACIVKIYNA